MQLQDLKATIRRLEELSHGFAQEAERLTEGEGDFLQMERVRYVSAIHDARSCMERARVALAQVCRRLEENARSHLRIVTHEWDTTEPSA
jgi:hypothetical protein